MARLFILTFIIALSSTGFAQNAKNYTGEVNLVNEPEQGTLFVKSTGYGSNKKTAIKDAAINAFNVLLFRGLPGSSYRDALITNEKEARENHKKYFNHFYNQGMQTFIMQSFPAAKFSKDKSGKKMNVELKINVSALRKDLEENNIIRKFGY